MKRGRESWCQTGLTLHILPEDLILTFQWRTLTPSCHSSSNVQIISCWSFSLFQCPLFCPFHSHNRLLVKIYPLSFLYFSSKKTLLNISYLQRSRYYIFPRLPTLISFHLYVNKLLCLFHSFLHNRAQITWSWRNLMRNELSLYWDLWLLIGDRKSERNLRRCWDQAGAGDTIPRWLSIGV